MEWPNLASKMASELLKQKEKIAFIESTTGGLISAHFISLPKASAFFHSSCVVYSPKSYKLFLPPDVLAKSKVFNTRLNYNNAKNYLQSKLLFVRVTAEMMKQKLRADWVIVESGSTGPDFYIPGLDHPFTAVGISGPNNFLETNLFELPASSKDREANMQEFKRLAVEMFNSSIQSILFFRFFNGYFS
eukprot:maker-scaffold_17-snap-gene-5.53-mRNA-1 protein AED:0.29 eAED:0.29 QI:4/0.66/0.5/0.75/1/1/4/0/188